MIKLTKPERGAESEFYFTSFRLPLKLAQQIETAAIKATEKNKTFISFSAAAVQALDEVFGSVAVDHAALEKTKKKSKHAREKLPVKTKKVVKAVKKAAKKVAKAKVKAEAKVEKAEKVVTKKNLADRARRAAKKAAAAREHDAGIPTHTAPTQPEATA